MDLHKDWTITDAMKNEGFWFPHEDHPYDFGAKCAPTYTIGYE